jgi:WD40 repeat protein
MAPEHIALHKDMAHLTQFVASRVLSYGLVVGVAAWMIGQTSGAQPVSKHAAGKALSPSDARNKETQTHTDYYGDALPSGAMTRMGTIRLRHRGARAVFSADGKNLISVGIDRVVRFWDVRTGKQVGQTPLRVAAQVRAKLQSVTLGPGGKLIAASEGETVYLFDAVTGKEIRHLRGGPSSLRQLAFSSDSSLLSAVNPDKHGQIVRVWSTSTGRAHGHPVRVQQGFSSSFGPDGKFFAVKGHDDKILLWELATGKMKRTLRSPGSWIRFAPDGKTLAVINNKTITLWDAATGKEQATFEQAIGPGQFCWAFSSDARFLAFGGGAGLTIWDVKNRRQWRRLPERNASGIAFSPGGKTLACWGDVQIQLWDIATSKNLHGKAGHDQMVLSVAASPDGKLIASAAVHDRSVRLWDAATGKPVGCLQSPDQFAWACRFSRDGQLVATGGSEGTFQLFEVPTRKERRRFVFADITFRGNSLFNDEAFCLLAQGKQLAAIRQDFNGPICGRIYVWDTATAKVLKRRPMGLKKHTRPTAGGGSTSWIETHTCFTPDGNAVTVRTDSGLILQDTFTGRPLAKIPLQIGRPLAFSMDGKLLAGATLRPQKDPFDGHIQEAVCIAELASAKEILRIPTGNVSHLCLSPDGRVLAAVDREALRLWDVATGKQFYRQSWPARPKALRQWSPVDSACFVPGGYRFATGMTDGTILVWDLAVPQRPASETSKKLGRQGLEELWADLGNSDAPKAHRAVHKLAAAPAETLPFLKVHLMPASGPAMRQVTKWIADLDSERFAVRRVAARKLGALGEQVEPALRQVLEGKPSVEVGHRVEAILAAPRAAPSATELRGLRAIRALELIGNSEACNLLRTLAKGANGCPETKDARAALVRLTRRPLTATSASRVNSASGSRP